MNMRDLQAALDQKTKPIGSLGRLEELAVQVGSVTGVSDPSAIHASLTIFAADHGIAVEEVSAFPQEVTRQMVANFLEGGAAANTIAREFSVPVMVVDCGLAETLPGADGLIEMRLGFGTANSACGPAMTLDVAQQAMSLGREYGASLEGNVACFGEMGIANTSSASLLLHKLTNISLADLVGRGTGVDNAGLLNKRRVLERAARRHGTLSAIEALAEVGGFEIGIMAGAMIGASKAGKLVVVDGFIATSAAALARALEADSEKAMVFAHQSAESGHRCALEWLGARPLLDLNMRLGEGTGALLAVPIIRAAVSLFGMASFEQAGVSGSSLGA